MTDNNDTNDSLGVISRGMGIKTRFMLKLIIFTLGVNCLVYWIGGAIWLLVLFGHSTGDLPRTQ